MTAPSPPFFCMTSPYPQSQELRNTSEVRHLCSRQAQRVASEQKRQRSLAIRPRRGDLMEQAGHHHPVHMLRQPLLQPESLKQEGSLKQRML